MLGPIVATQSPLDNDVWVYFQAIVAVSLTTSKLDYYVEITKWVELTKSPFVIICPVIALPDFKAKLVVL